MTFANELGAREEDWPLVSGVSWVVDFGGESWQSRTRLFHEMIAGLDVFVHNSLSAPLTSVILWDVDPDEIELPQYEWHLSMIDISIRAQHALSIIDSPAREFQRNMNSCIPISFL